MQNDGIAKKIKPKKKVGTKTIVKPIRTGDIITRTAGSKTTPRAITDGLVKPKNG